MDEKYYEIKHTHTTCTNLTLLAQASYEYINTSFKMFYEMPEHITKYNMQCTRNMIFLITARYACHFCLYLSNIYCWKYKIILYIKYNIICNPIENSLRECTHSTKTWKLYTQRQNQTTTTVQVILVYYVLWPNTAVEQHYCITCTFYTFVCVLKTRPLTDCMVTCTVLNAHTKRFSRKYTIVWVLILEL